VQLIDFQSVAQLIDYQPLMYVLYNILC